VIEKDKPEVIISSGKTLPIDDEENYWNIVAWESCSSLFGPS
jgi:hypothetical protein